MRFGVACLVAATALAGCTHRQLTRSTADATGTVMAIQYRVVLANLALMTAHPEGLPQHVRLADGVVQITDEGGFGSAGGLTTFGGTDLGLDRFGPSGSRTVSEQWGTDAVGDPRDVKALQDLYRTALGLLPLPDPEAIAHLKRGRPSGDDAGRSSGGAAEADGRVPVEVLIRDVPPPGWFGVGCRRDVPTNACYVGRHRDRYAWVTNDGVPGLSRFTLTVLAALKYESAGADRTRGLAVTR